MSGECEKCGAHCLDCTCKKKRKKKLKWINYSDKQPKLNQKVIIKFTNIIYLNSLIKLSCVSAIYTDKLTASPCFCDESLNNHYPDVEKWIPFPSD